MQSLFSPDSKIMRTMSRVGDLMVLNLLFLATCIPLVTIGAASAALYTVCFRFGTEKEGKLVRTYFRAFRGNLRQGAILWLIVLFFGAVSAANAWIFYSAQGVLHWAFLPFAVLFVLVVLLDGYIFPLLSQFSNSVGYTLKNALLLSVGYLPRSLLIAALNVFPFALLLFDLYRFLQTGFLWAMLYFAAAAYGNAALLKKVFAPYMGEQTEKEDLSDDS